MAPKPFWQDTFSKLGSMGLSIAIFFAVLLVIFFIAGKAKGKFQKPISIFIFLFPAVLLVSIGLVIPLIQTVFFSFKDPNSIKFVGWENYKWILTNADMHKVLINTLLWLLVTPFLTTFLGLVLAIFLDRMKRESIPKSLIFMPMAISFVGGSLIWNLMYSFQESNRPQTGLIGQLTLWLGLPVKHILLWSPWNNFFLMAVYIWGFTGFSMVILSAAIKAIPSEIEEAAQLDGATGFKLFRTVTVPMVRTTIIVVLTTAMVGTLKLFDVVHTMTGGNFKTDVLANRMVDENFVYLNYGHGSVLAVLIFLLVIPISYYNIRSLRAERKH